MTDFDPDTARRTYARHVTFTSGADDPRLEVALAEIPREAFLGPGPWQLPVLNRATLGAYRATPDAEPHWLYQDQVVGIIPEKELNNGMPSFLTFLISLGRAQPGEHAVHIGAGVGYYTAILARLVGEAGRVTAIEYEPELAARAQANLAGYPQVTALQGDGAALPLAPADVILVNAGAARPMDLWLDALKDGGRLILPLCVGYKTPGGRAMTRGAIFLIERDGGEFSARFKSPTGIYPCFGVSDPEGEASLTQALRGGGSEKVRRLYRTSDVPADVCWAKGTGWALAYE
ncbi:MAG TPA: methyltransferase domain-containing protein [Caulobacteraceae bacterium]|jgi:protein-L-isoaspartate(D-aspartate) O-methyltransferase|nr:methyltransferase domain-containing protein [Caulobacteraceae bacterium]